MFHDLSCIWHEANIHAHREETVMIIRLGIDCFALANEVSESLSDRDRSAQSAKYTCRCPVTSAGPRSVKGLFCSRCSIQPLNLASLQGTSSLQNAVRMQQGLPWKHGTALNTQQLTRLTLSTEDSSAAAQAFTGTHAAASSYDLLAVQPMSERVLQQVQKSCYLHAAL